MQQQEEATRKKRAAKIKLFNKAKVFIRNGKTAEDYKKFAKHFMQDDIDEIGFNSFAKVLDLFDK